MDEADPDIDLDFPKWRDIRCPFCGALVRLVRQGGDNALGERVRFWYVEKTWAESFEDHPCVWTINRPAGIGDPPARERGAPIRTPARSGQMWLLREEE